MSGDHPELFLDGRPVRPEVVAFAKAMEAKLRANDHKPHWRRCTIEYLQRRLTQEREELRRAVKRGNGLEILHEGADVANFCMMLADLSGALP